MVAASRSKLRVFSKDGKDATFGGRLPAKEAAALIRGSYELVKAQLPKKVLAKLKG